MSNPAPLGPRLRALRERAGLTVEALAEAASVSKGYLSRLENGLKTPSIAVLLRLADALGTGVAELLGERLEPGAVRVTRAAARTVLPGEDGAHGIEALTRDGALLDAFILHPADEFSPDGHSAHAGEELFLVLHGQMELRFADRALVLEAGDCAQFPGHLPHRIRRLGPAPARALVAIARPQRSAR